MRIDLAIGNLRQSELVLANYVELVTMAAQLLSKYFEAVQQPESQCGIARLLKRVYEDIQWDW
jgi:hypothetical protein